MQMVNKILGQNLQSWILLSIILPVPKLWRDQFAHENGEQPLFIKMLSNSPFDLQGKTRQIDPVKR